jgi:hypothetical protein
MRLLDHRLECIFCFSMHAYYSRHARNFEAYLIE